MPAERSKRTRVAVHASATAKGYVYASAPVEAPRQRRSATVLGQLYSLIERFHVPENQGIIPGLMFQETIKREGRSKKTVVGVLVDDDRNVHAEVVLTSNKRTVVRVKKAPIRLVVRVFEELGIEARKTRVPPEWSAKNLPATKTTSRLMVDATIRDGECWVAPAKGSTGRRSKTAAIYGQVLAIAATLSIRTDTSANVLQGSEKRGELLLRLFDEHGGRRGSLRVTSSKEYFILFEPAPLRVVLALFEALQIVPLPFQLKRPWTPT